MSTKRSADGVLLQWGDRLFYAPVRRKGTPHTAKVSKFWRSADDVRAQIKRTINKVPEVMVKITSKGNSGRGMAAIREHLDYISRNGEVDLEDGSGGVWSGRNQVHELAGWWQISGAGGAAIAERTRHREALNIAVSMPPGTDRQAVLNAAREFSRESFGNNHEYALAAHNDEDHPHVHIIVLTRGRDGRRLKHGRAELQQWREGFAQALRDRGMDANASSRLTRGTVRRTETQARRHHKQRTGRERVRPDINPVTARQAHDGPLQAWRTIAMALAQSDDRDDRLLAMQVIDFVRDMPVIALRAGQPQSPRTQDSTRQAVLAQVARWHATVNTQAAGSAFPREVIEAELLRKNPRVAQWLTQARKQDYVREHEAELERQRRGRQTPPTTKEGNGPKR